MEWKAWPLGVVSTPFPQPWLEHTHLVPAFVLAELPNVVEPHEFCTQGALQMRYVRGVVMNGEKAESAYTSAHTYTPLSHCTSLERRSSKIKLLRI